MSRGQEDEPWRANQVLGDQCTCCLAGRRCTFGAEPPRIAAGPARTASRPASRESSRLADAVDRGGHPDDAAQQMRDMASRRTLEQRNRGRFIGIGSLGWRPRESMRGLGSRLQRQRAAEHAQTTRACRGTPRLRQQRRPRPSSQQAAWPQWQEPRERTPEALGSGPSLDGPPLTRGARGGRLGPVTALPPDEASADADYADIARLLGIVPGAPGGAASSDHPASESRSETSADAPPLTPAERTPADNSAEATPSGRRRWLRPSPKRKTPDEPALGGGPRDSEGPASHDEDDVRLRFDKDGVLVGRRRLAPRRALDPAP